MQDDGASRGYPQTERARLRFQLAAKVDSARQYRAEAVLGPCSYWLLASRAYRFAETRTRVVEAMAANAEQLLSMHDATSAAAAQVFLWSAYSHLFMHIEDLASLLQATQAFGKEWEQSGHVVQDLIATQYLSFGAEGEGANPVSVLRQVAKKGRPTNMMRAMWLPGQSEWSRLHAGVSDKGTLAHGWLAVRTLADRCRDIVRAIVGKLESEEGRKWYAMYIRYKHGAPWVAMDVFHPSPRTNLVWQDPETARGTPRDVMGEPGKICILMPHPPGRRPDGVPGPMHLQGFERTAGSVQLVQESSRTVSVVENLVCRSIVVRAEAEGHAEFLMDCGTPT
jgi:hypothetical protein